MHRTLGASSAGPSTCESLFWLLLLLLLGALTGSRWLCGPSALAGAGLSGSGTRGVGSDEGGALGASLRSTRGPTSGWALALSGPDRAAAGLFRGGALAVSTPPSLAGLLCAALTLPATELVAVEGSRFTTGEVASAAAGLFGGDGRDKQGRKGRSEHGEPREK